ncbi:MAG: PKD domain-containing protein [bacterium]
MRRLLPVILLIFALTSWAADVAVLYNGTADVPAGVKFGAWGASSAATEINNTATFVLDKVYALRMPIDGRYQGGRLELTQPVDATGVFTDNTGYLELYLRPLTGATLPQLRFTFVTAEGQGTLLATPEEMTSNMVVDKMWYRVGIPLNHITGKVGGAISRIIITAEVKSDLLFNRIALVHDTTPLTLQATAFPPVQDKGHPLYFSAFATSGFAVPVINWNFNTGAGASIDATGDHVLHHYDTPGDYKVTATVRDADGNKEPVKVEIVVKVLP